ncbi:LPXTG cell wall anchor domain-containing protein [Dolosicoccus paucivorans]|uniref:LPXTG cell wall anchor domain-containing protein n=1 Tax=Dolosicoccus paucivorans TaxID=84521 RepID=UPI000883D818|nr:LPXTG cell wall anchor domain-containing protein [Dolosicoccus paucivorans]SDI59747.1 hypothetical protein SAMN04487994_10253 [Dolosicoccus paucivorans]
MKKSRLLKTLFLTNVLLSGVVVTNVDDVLGTNVAIAEEALEVDFDEEEEEVVEEEYTVSYEIRNKSGEVIEVLQTEVWSDWDAMEESSVATANQFGEELGFGTNAFNVEGTGDGIVYYFIEEEYAVTYEIRDKDDNVVDVLHTEIWNDWDEMEKESLKTAKQFGKDLDFDENELHVEETSEGLTYYFIQKEYTVTYEVRDKDDKVVEELQTEIWNDWDEMEKESVKTAKKFGKDLGFGEDKFNVDAKDDGLTYYFIQKDEAASKDQADNEEASSAKAQSSQEQSSEEVSSNETQEPQEESADEKEDVKESEANEESKEASKTDNNNESGSGEADSKKSKDKKEDNGNKKMDTFRGYDRKEGAINAAEIHMDSGWNDQYDKYTGYHVYQIEDGTWNVDFNYDGVKTIGLDREELTEQDIQDALAQYADVTGKFKDGAVAQDGRALVKDTSKEKSTASSPKSNNSSGRTSSKPSTKPRNKTTNKPRGKTTTKPRGKTTNKSRGKTNGKVLPNTGDYSFFTLAASSLLAGLGLVKARRNND